MLKRHFVTFVLLSHLLCGCLAGQPDKTAVSGKVSLHGGGMAGVEVLAWPATAMNLAGRPPFRSAPSAADGGFTLQLPAGDYYLLARGNGHYSFYGRNPVAVPATGIAELKIGLVPLAPAPPPPVALEIESGVSGELTVDGRPYADGVVYAYTDLTSRLKGMGYALSAPSDEDGRFEIPLPAGTYYLLARLRKDGGMVTGPLRAGDFIGYAPLNPLRVAEGRVTLVSIPLLEVPEKVDQMTATLFGQTSISGRVLDRDGRPVAGARAVLYDEAQMLNRPLYVSRPTEADGSFVLSFPTGGTYYLAARQQLGGAPSPGELYGTWDGTPDHSLQVTTGERKSGIDLIVEEMW